MRDSGLPVIFAPNGSGAIISGVQDLNDSGAVSTNQSLTGSYNVAGNANGRGSVTLVTSVGTLSFVAYVVNANQLKLMEIDSSSPGMPSANRVHFLTLRSLVLRPSRSAGTTASPGHSWRAE